MKQKIMAFISRNKSVFSIGFATFIVFLIIIAISEIRRLNNPNSGPLMIKVQEGSEKDVSMEVTQEPVYQPETEPTPEPTGIYINTNPDEITESTESTSNNFSETDLNFPTMKVEYTDNGFVPKNAKAVQGQKVRFINETAGAIKIKQKTSFYKEFNEPVLIPANGFLEFRLYKDGVWTYEEEITKSFGSIIILKQ